MPSTGVKHRALAATLALAVIATLTAAVTAGSAALAAPLGTTIPTNCVRHTSFSGGTDVPGDYRCAGIAIQYHTLGVSSSPFPIWAGQWLFLDQAGQYRVGSCTLNRGVHPTISSPSSPVTQQLPNDPTGAKAAYLTWKYGDTRDNLTASALWAVFHYYAQDAAGSNRAPNATSPLVPRLDGLAVDSGRADLQSTALALHDEATRFAGKWLLSVQVGADGVALVTLLSGATPVPGQTVSVLVGGSDVVITATTGADGKATVTVPLPPGTVTVVATVPAPGAAVSYRGVPASPDPQGAQILVSGGNPSVLRAEVQVATPSATTTPTTTVPAITEPPTTIAPTTTVPTTTVPTTTTTVTPTTSTTTTTTLSTQFPPTTAAAQDPPPLPRTGGGGDGGVAYLATALLVGGIGLLGTLRRRDQLAYTRSGDTG